jgi:PAS domain S-box-containing protein
VERRARPRSALLLPAVRLMNRLSYPRKFVLISVLFLAALGVVMSFMLLEFGKNIEFTAREIEGTRYLRPLIVLYRDAGEARRLSRAFARGDKAIRPEVNRKLEAIETALRKVEAVDAELGALMDSTSRVKPLRKNWDNLKTESADLAAKHVDKLFIDLLKEIRSLYSHIGDHSNLILDPDLDTYYLMDSILLKLVEGQGLMMDTSIEGERFTFQKSLSPEDRAEFQVLLGRIESNLVETREGAQKAFDNNPSGTAGPRLQKAYDEFVLNSRTAVQGLQSSLIDAKTLNVSPEIVTAAVARPLAMSFDLWGRATAELDELMRARIASYERRRQIAWIGTAIALALVGYLWVAFYAGVMGTVDNLERASQQMLGANPGKEMVLETHDELGRVARSFNAIAQRLRHEWEQATEDNARRRAAELRLQESEERTRLIIQAALDAVITIDLEGRVTEWNPQAAAMFGWARDETLGKPLSALIIPPKYRASHEAGMHRYRQTGEGPVLNKRIEIQAIRRDQTEFPVELSITPLTSGKNTSFSAFVRDITERKRNEEELKKAKDLAEAASRTKSEFLANMSHELRTPLNSIIGFSTVILKGKGKTLAPQEALYLERILDNGKHLLGLINTILDLSKIEAGKVELNLVPVDLDALVRETLAQLEGRIVDKKIGLVAELPPRLVPFPTDPDKLKQVLINLVGNAIKFTEKGSVTVRVVADPKNGVPRRIDVVDTGVGIPKDMQEKIFEAFQQVDSGMARKYEGTGLGLTISRSLCNLLGCRIEVESEIGRGSTFSVHLLPVGAATEGPTTTRLIRQMPEPVPAAHNDDQLKDRLVLVIDDEDDSRFLLRQYVSDCGCHVAEADSGGDAIEKARLLKPDLITLDLMMPGMNGWEILRALKSDPEVYDIPVVVVSIVASENRGTIFGAADHLNKPVSREELCAVLRRNVRHGKARVLVVDDSEDARRVMSAFLADEDAVIETAADGQEALSKLPAFKPDLIILDLMMPVMDGMTFLNSIRRDPAYAHVPVVVATAKELTVQEMRHLEASVSVVLRKSNELRTELARVVRSMLLQRSPKHPGTKEEEKPRILVKVRALLADMVPGYLDSRRKEIATIREALGRNEFEAIRVLGHNMKGTGSSYGFPPITEFGRRIEEAAKDGVREEIQKQVAELADYLTRVEFTTE